MRIKTYIINLEKSTVRKQYMQGLLSPYSFLDVEFVNAIDGRLLTEEEKQELFNYQKSKLLYGRVLNAGEVGCALSHRKIYETILKREDPYALVLEDDIDIQRDLNLMPIEMIDRIMLSSKPRVLMLSGDFSFYSNKPVTRIYSAVGAYAYFINKTAARQILNRIKPSCVADDWAYYKRIGLRLFAVHPYMIDANLNMALLGSDVKQDTWGIDRSQLSLKENFLRGINGFIMKFFKKIDHYEYKTLIYHNKIYPRNNTLKR